MLKDVLVKEIGELGARRICEDVEFGSMWVEFGLTLLPRGK